LRRLVNAVWLHATEAAHYPSTKTVDMLIHTTFPVIPDAAATSPVIGGTNWCGHGMMAAICPTCAVAQPTQDSAIMRNALESIAANGCCDRCQEAALVARKALALSSAESKPDEEPKP
jgi:hypothetical protein